MVEVRNDLLRTNADAETIAHDLLTLLRAGLSSLNLKAEGVDHA
jgi:predicted N-formylglutamate amidohydrolase